MKSKSRTEKFWDSWADKFDKRAKNFTPLPIEKTKKYLKNSDIVLDVGCATGAAIIEIADCVQKAVGIDISSKMIDVAQRKANELNIGNISFRQTTLFDKESGNERFNAIIAFNVIHLIKGKQELIQRMFELLKPNGFVIIKTISYEKRTFSNILLKFITLAMVRLKVILYMEFIKMSDFKEILCKEGFEIIEVENLKSADYFIVAKKV